MNKYEAARKARMEQHPEYAASRRAHDNRRRPERTRSAGASVPPKSGRKRKPSKAILCPIDGEGFEFPCTPYQLPADKEGKVETVDTESRYCLLQILGRPALWNEAGLSTEEVFRYLFEAPANYSLW